MILHHASGECNDSVCFDSLVKTNVSSAHNFFTVRKIYYYCSISHKWIAGEKFGSSSQGKKPQERYRCSYVCNPELFNYMFCTES